MGSSTDPLVRSKGDKSNTSVRAEPFQHLIQHVKQYDPMLYEALRRLSTSVSNVITNASSETGRDLDDWEGWIILPGARTPAVDVLVDRPRLKLDPDKKIVLERCSGSAKVAPTTGNYTADILRSNDGGVTWVSLFTPGNIATILQGATVSENLSFAITELFNDDQFRVDDVTSGGVTGPCFILVGKKYPK